VLLDLIEARGERGKWFATAKGAGFLDIALECARSSNADPATLVRAARDFAGKKPEFSAQVALCALSGLLHGAGYDPDPANVHAAYDHLMAGAVRMGNEAWAHEQVAKLAAGPCSPGREHIRQSLVQLFERGGKVAPSRGAISSERP
jgi:hypothetical protein